MRTPPLPTFTEFYRAINRRDPFPWQARLADRVARYERWPAEIGVPTGLGKTACLDIAIWWLASQSDRAPGLRTAPTRIWWVVNRRLLVDSTAEHARTVAGALYDPETTALDATGHHVIECVAERLRSLWVDAAAPPLGRDQPPGAASPRVLPRTLRGRPLSCAHSRCTAPACCSEAMGPVGRPSTPQWPAPTVWFCLDEAHLAGHLRTLGPALAACNPAARKLLGAKRSRPTVVSLTATGNAAQSDRFDLDDDDEAHLDVRQRLDAAKPLHVNVVNGEAARRLVEATVALIHEAPTPAACLVFCNTPKTARETFEHLGKRLPEAEVLLLTGLVREREAARIRARILDPEHGMATTRPADAPRRHHLIVVATQTLEVGADIDAEYLVTEGCGVRALTQRLGRLNRLGRFSHARASYVHVPPPKSRGGKNSGADADTWPVYEREPAIVYRFPGGIEAATLRLGRHEKHALGKPLVL